MLLWKYEDSKRRFRLVLDCKRVLSSILTMHQNYHSQLVRGIKDCKVGLPVANTDLKRSF